MNISTGSSASATGRTRVSGIRGHAVWNFTVMFLKMWNSFRPTEEDYCPFRPHVHHPDEFGSDGISPTPILRWTMRISEKTSTWRS